MSSFQFKYNPYDVLGVSQDATSAEITKAFALAMKKRQYPLDVIAQARSILTNQRERLIADCLKPILPTPRRFKKVDTSNLNQNNIQIDFIQDLDELDQLISNPENLMLLKRRLGESILQDFNLDDI